MNKKLELTLIDVPGRQTAAFGSSTNAPESRARGPEPRKARPRRSVCTLRVCGRKNYRLQDIQLSKTTGASALGLAPARRLAGPRARSAPSHVVAATSDCTDYHEFFLPREASTASLETKWRIPGSNRRPPGCKPGALPAELIPRIESSSVLVRAKGRMVRR